MTTKTHTNTGHPFRAPIALLLLLTILVASGVVGGCGGTSTSDLDGADSSDNISGRIGTSLTVGDVVITVKSLQSAFQPISPAQKISDEPLVAPAAGITFYQAYVNIQNNGQSPIRVDPMDFLCRIENTLSTLEPTRSGPEARSLIYGTSLDVVLTFRGATGAEPTLVYSPPWYSGLVLFSANPTAGETGATSTTITTGTTTGS